MKVIELKYKDGTTWYWMGFTGTRYTKDIKKAKKYLTKTKAQIDIDKYLFEKDMLIEKVNIKELKS